jgi:hypothetical protein
MSTKLSPALVCPLRVSISESSWFFHLTKSLPRQSQLTLTPSTPPGGNHRKKKKSRQAFFTSCKNGGGDWTPYHVGRMQHTQDSNTSAWKGCLCPNASKGHSDRMGGNAGPSHGPPHPEGHPPGTRGCPPSWPKSAPKLWREQAASRRNRGLAQARRRTREGRRRSLSSDSAPPGFTSGSPGPHLGEGRERGAAASQLRGSSSWEAPRGREGRTEGPDPRRSPGPSPALQPRPARRPPRSVPRLRKGRGRLAEGNPRLRPGRCPSPASSPAAPARPPRRRALTSGCAGRDGPAEPPAAACVSAPRERSQQRLVRAAKAPSSAESGGSSGSSQHPGPRTRNYFSTPLPPPPPPPPATSLRHRLGVGGVTVLRRRGLFDVRGIRPRGQVVPRDSCGSGSA